MNAVVKQTAIPGKVTDQTAKRLLEGKSLGGPPTKYNPNVLRTIKHYVANFQEYGNQIPSVAGLCKALKINRETLYIWAKHKDKKELSDTLKVLKDNQESILLDGGLSGTFNPTIAKLVLSKHGYTENTANTGTSVNVTINRGSVQVETQGQTIDIETD